MIKHFKSDLEKRRKQILKHYYLEIGSMIKKKRLENNLTQEELSRGIISHTYLSKIEHNSITVNKDSLFMIMERMDMSNDSYQLPEEMLDALEESFECFFYLDFEKYRILFEESKKYEYGILIDLARFGYYVMTQDYVRAKISYDELHRYLCAVEDYGFTIYAVYAVYYNIMINDFMTARKIIEQAKQYHSMSEHIYALFEYAKFIVYGKLHLFNQSRDGYENAKNILLSNGAALRIQEMSMYINLFRKYEDNDIHIGFIDQDAHFLNQTHYCEYLILYALSQENPSEHLSKITEEKQCYPFALYLLASEAQKKEDPVMIQKYLNKLHEVEKKHSQNDISFFNMFQAKMKGDLVFKEFLIEYTLPYAIKQQNLYYMRFVTVTIVSILYQHKRYKDAISYTQKFDKAKEKINGVSSDFSGLATESI